MATTNKQLNGHLKKDPKSGIYHATFKTRNGKTRSRTTKTKNQGEARSILKASRVVEMSERAHNLTAEALTVIMAERKVTCANALAEFQAWRLHDSAPNTVHQLGVTLRRFFSELGAEEWPVNKLNFSHCDAFVNARDAGKVSNREVRLAALKSFFSLLTAKAYYVGNPAQLVSIRHRELSHDQQESKPRVAMTYREVQHILNNTTGFWRWTTALSYWAGYRLNECACLEWASISADEIVVHTSKNNGRVAVKISHPVFGRGALRPYLMEAESGRILLKGHPIEEQFLDGVLVQDTVNSDELG